ncbi:MAG TPA: SpvB/TcaC N-terminal domain-containing protein, partial [Kofleriaceae bacterium]
MRNALRSRVAILSAGVIVSQLAFAAPHDPFSNALPSADTKPPEGLVLGGDPSVASGQGAATYSFPIDLPPGRAGIQPHLALSYSSENSLRGGIAAGWMLSGLPTIERDPASPVVPAYRYDGEPIVEAPGDTGTGTRYRPLFDQGMTRIERSGASWIVSTPDGIERTYAGIQGGSDSATIWNLHKEEDAYGNRVSYSWSRVMFGAGTDYVLTAIEYTSNSNAGIAANARIEPIYATWAAEYCTDGGVPIGAELDHHFGRSLIHGSLRLTGFRVKVRDVAAGSWRVVRQIDLGYDETELACNHDRPPLRYLTRITTTAYAPDGTPTVAPPITFGYGALTRDLSRVYTTYWRGLGERGTEKGAESRLMDFDGDGVMDQVRSMPPAEGRVRCRLGVRRGFFGGQFSLDEQSIELPTAAWDGDPAAGPAEHDQCTLDAQL